jgi:hypothetical protein
MAKKTRACLKMSRAQAHAYHAYMDRLSATQDAKAEYFEIGSRTEAQGVRY